MTDPDAADTTDAAAETTDGAAAGRADGADGEAADGATGLAARVGTAEALPLADRAGAFAELHDELRTRLEDGGGAVA